MSTNSIAAYSLSNSAWQFTSGQVLSIPSVYTPTLNMAAENQQPINGLELSWEILDRNDQVGLRSAPGTGTSIQVASGTAPRFAVNDVLQPVNNTGVPQDEYLLVYAVDLENDTLTVVRQHAGTGVPSPPPPDPPTELVPVTIEASWSIRRLYSSMSSNATMYSSTRAGWINSFSNFVQRVVRKCTVDDDFTALKVFDGTQSAEAVSTATADVMNDMYRAVTLGIALPTDPQGAVSYTHLTLPTN